ncbi:unnamed protein product [Darwinula stevensoni]|uniref:Uncharacterized protein n=1 Tax=Darwinula stevensoni TaxID=69355 RepID=A0A7R8X5T8_9CRUS|nr:unnamed protein product [Darwinula stevensoni]CAG0885025.1 unnamed protein product [Darwinula stevensoni]
MRIRKADEDDQVQQFPEDSSQSQKTDPPRTPIFEKGRSSPSPSQIPQNRDESLRLGVPLLLLPPPLLPPPQRPRVPRAGPPTRLAASSVSSQSVWMASFGVCRAIEPNRLVVAERRPEGHAVLETFDDVIDALTLGHRVQLVMDFRACGVADKLVNLEQAVRTLSISEFLRITQIVTLLPVTFGSTVAILVKPFFVRSVGYLDSNSVFTYVMQEMNAVDYSIHYNSSFTCTMNAGVTVYDRSRKDQSGRYRQSSTLKTYKDLKKALLTGKDVTRVISYDLCWEPPPFRVSAGYPTRDFYFVNKGKESPPVVVRNPGKGGNFAVNSYHMNIFPDNSIKVLTAVWDMVDFDKEHSDPESYDCHMDEGVVFLAEKTAPEAVATFAGALDALTAGKELQALVDLEFCRSGSSEPMLLAESHRLVLWGYYNEESVFGTPFFGFSHDHITEEGDMYMEELTAYEDGRVKVILETTSRPDGRLLAAHEFNCSIGDDVTFFAGRRDRKQLKNFQELKDAIGGGDQVAVSSNFGDCGVGPSARVSGGASVSNPFLFRPIGGEDEAFLSAGGLTRNVNPTGGRYVYQSMPVVVYPDDSALFLPALYDTTTFENLLGDEFYYECDVDDGRGGAAKVYV